MRIRNCAIGLVSLAILVAIGCDQGGTTKVDSANPGKSSAPTEVRLGYFANITHAQGVLGVSSGEFERAIAPAKLTTRVFNAGPALVEALLAGEIDIAYIGPGPAITAHQRTRGEGIHIISGAAANGVVIVARKDAPISSLDDLVGKRIATPQLGNTQDISARHFLKSKGVTDLSTILPIANAEQSAMMARGEIDAAWVPEPWGARLIAEGGRLIAEEKDLWPTKRFNLTVVIASQKFLKEHPETAAKLLAVHESWTQRLQANPQSHSAALGDAIFALTTKRLPAEVISQALSRVEFTNDPMPETLQKMAEWSAELGFSKGSTSIEGLIQQKPTTQPR